MSTPQVVGDLSEREILSRIAARTGTARATMIGVGDDAAVLAVSGAVVATTDTLIEGPDFRREWSDGYSLGWKAAAVNLADIAAMGARPTALLVALALPNDTPIAYVERITDGLREACEQLAPGCAVVGGDLTQSPVLTVAVTALGDTEGSDAVLRSGARPGDTVAIAGDMGVAARGLDVLFARFDGCAPRLDELDAADRRAVEQQLRPTPPLALGVRAARAGATAMMDVSDGLVLDATRMATASGVAIDLVRASLGDDPERALRGGEDHALLATFPGEVADGFRAIGRVREAGDAPLLVGGAAYAGPAGWDPYRDWRASGPAVGWTA
ncbi:MAG: thiamine-phosphate kinase [Microbacterium gubbeenense]|uniref:thiamine-phosphate kinase n=1 Tax=Microbacterium gubbeenense TaxID=159896 RepID=UPI00040290A3|nr:thiamine-phosphate kinase [Microbacterium gubbeenense]